MPNFPDPIPVKGKDDIDPGDRVIVTDPDDDLAGWEGEVTEVSNGFASTNLMATVRMDQRPPGDDREQRFYVGQLGVTASEWNRG